MPQNIYSLIFSVSPSNTGQIFFGQFHNYSVTSRNIFKDHIELERNYI